MAILYKYRSALEGIRILLTSKIWFSAPSGFEDKSDCQVKYKFTNLLINKEHAISVADKILSRETPQDYQAIQQFGEEDILKFKNLVMEGSSPEEILRNTLEKHIYSDTRVLSLSKRHDIQQMWQRYADAYNDRGIAKSGLKRYKDAIVDYNMAIQLNPEDAFAYYNRGLAYGDLYRYEEAVKDFDMYIRLKPDDTERYNQIQKLKKQWNMR